MEVYTVIHKTIKLYENREDVILTPYVLNDLSELLNGKKRQIKTK